ncbi:PhnO protein [Lachnospiraceae bacterium KM106-2]|nr:PhnO protein [Lachnospiraceae bacterium KM106-2]
MIYRMTDDIKEKEEKQIFEGLLQYNLERIEDKTPKDLGIYLEDEEANIIAGLIGHTHGNWLLVKYLWVSEDLRGQQIGSSILEKAEKAAKERGCKYVFLDTFNFQAPKFYEKHGYEKVFTLSEYPIKGERYYYVKDLL